jgi:ribosomal subunit interface protein
VPEHYRQHVSEKLAKIERYDDKIIRIDVELSHEKNPRQSDYCQRVEITCVSRGPVVRAEACSGDFYSALDHAAAKLDARLRRSADRRRVHRGRHAPISVAEATSGLPTDDLISASSDPISGVADSRTAGSMAGATSGATAGATATATLAPFDATMAAGVVTQADGDGMLAEDDDDQPWHIARMKEHPKLPMTVDDALFQMELVGHDFYLFMDKESGRASVVYRRVAYDYGIITLEA